VLTVKRSLAAFLVAGCNAGLSVDAGTEASVDAGVCPQPLVRCTTEGATCHQPSCYACYCGGRVSGYTRLPGDTDDVLICRDGGWVKGPVAVDCFGLGRFDDSTCAIPKDGGSSWTGSPCPPDASADHD
jgi:hypothetical protein